MKYIEYKEYLKLEDKTDYQPVVSLELYEKLKGNMPRFSITVSQLTAKELNEIEIDEPNINETQNNATV